MSSSWDHSGPLEKKRHLRYYKHWFALRGAELHYFNAKTDIHPKHIMQLRSAKLNPTTDHVAFEVTFADSTVFQLRAPTESEKNQWIAAFRKAIASAGVSSLVTSADSASSASKRGFQKFLTDKV